MSERLYLREDLRGEMPADYASYALAGGATITKSVSSSTTRIALNGREMIRKRYVYPLGRSLKASLRNTLVRPSRAEREFRMLRLFRERLGEKAVPEPIAFGERRTCLLLNEAILLTEAVPGGATLATTALNHPSAARELGGFLARMHQAGLIHGSLFARNVLLTPNGGFRLVDLDQAQAHASGRLPPLGTRAKDLSFLGDSIKGSRTDRLRALAAYARAVGEENREIGLAALAWREEARDRLDRRKRERPPGRRIAEEEGRQSTGR